MKTVVSIMLSAFLLAIPLSSQALFNKKSPDEQRQELQDERKVALDKLYAEKSSTREELKSAKGYAVFSSLGINVLLVSTESGSVMPRGLNIPVNKIRLGFAGYLAGHQVLGRQGS